jgi:hypothetical protein
MTLTPTLKLFAVSFAFLINMALLIWLGIKVDLLALDFNVHIYNIVFTIITVLNGSASALLAYLGIKAPAIDPADHQAVIDERDALAAQVRVYRAEASATIRRAADEAATAVLTIAPPTAPPA